MSWPGSYIDYQYNARNWITAVLNRKTDTSTLYEATYYYNDWSLWDHTGNPLKRTENIAGSTYNTTLRYDAVYRQTEETKRDSSNNVVYTLSYGYDAVGNRTTETIDGTTRYYTYDNNDKLTAISGGGQSASLSYDNNGNPFDRLRASMTGVSGTVTDTYELDTFGRSVSSSGTTPNPYRGVYPERSRRGGAWGYITDATLRSACSAEAAFDYEGWKLRYVARAPPVCYN